MHVQENAMTSPERSTIRSVELMVTPRGLRHKSPSPDYAVCTSLSNLSQSDGIRHSRRIRFFAISLNRNTSEYFYYILLHSSESGASYYSRP